MVVGAAVVFIVRAVGAAVVGAAVDVAEVDRADVAELDSAWEDVAMVVAANVVFGVASGGVVAAAVEVVGSVADEVHGYDVVDTSGGGVVAHLHVLTPPTEPARVSCCGPLLSQFCLREHTPSPPASTVQVLQLNFIAHRSAHSSTQGTDGSRAAERGNLVMVLPL